MVNMMVEIMVVGINGLHHQSFKLDRLSILRHKVKLIQTCKYFVSFFFILKNPLHDELLLVKYLTFHLRYGTLSVMSFIFHLREITTFNKLLKKSFIVMKKIFIVCFLCFHFQSFYVLLEAMEKSVVFANCFIFYPFHLTF
jgi:hypothetical protein